MDAVTYPDATVAATLNDLFVPVRVNIEESSKLAFQYGAIWTPNINIIEAKEHAVYRVEGWLAPSEFVTMLHLAKGHYLFSGKKFEDAAATFAMVAENYTRSDFAPEALYYVGVSRYLATSDVEEIKSAWGKLQRQHPQSTWTMRADILG